jgi:hypothetical protein
MQAKTFEVKELLRMLGLNENEIQGIALMAAKLEQDIVSYCKEMLCLSTISTAENTHIVGEELSRHVIKLMTPR